MEISDTSKWAIKKSGSSLRNTTARTLSSTATALPNLASCEKRSRTMTFIGGASIVAKATLSSISTCSMV